GLVKETLLETIKAATLLAGELRRFLQDKSKYKKGVAFVSFHKSIFMFFISTKYSIIEKHRLIWKWFDEGRMTEDNPIPWATCLVYEQTRLDVKWKHLAIYLYCHIGDGVSKDLCFYLY
ncbi:hypothetical protein ACJX0J_040258, partial [Zea mays]